MTKANPDNPVICSACLQAKSSLKNNLHCGICDVLLCKDCVHFHDDTFFSFLKEIPVDLSHKVYCLPCYDQKVEPAKAPYLEVKEKAKDVYVFFKKHNVPLIRRSKNFVNVENCPDREEILLRLAFFAAEQSFNALVEVNLIPEKRVINGYQSLYWSGKAYPAEIRVSSLDENRYGVKDKPQPERIRKKKK